MKIVFQNYEIAIAEDALYRNKSTDNNFAYDFVYLDEEANQYRSSNHAIKIFKDGQLIMRGVCYHRKIYLLQGRT